MALDPLGAMFTPPGGYTDPTAPSMFSTVSRVAQQALSEEEVGETVPFPIVPLFVLTGVTILGAGLVIRNLLRRALMGENQNHPD